MEPKEATKKKLQKEVEEKKAATLAAAQARKALAEEKRAAAQAAAEARKALAEERKAAAQAAAEEKKREAERKREAMKAAAEARKKEAEAKRSSAARKKEAAKAVNTAKPSSTISLGFLGFGGDKSDQKPVAKTVSAAPRGVPTISRWRKNRDGSITGEIYGSRAFGEGESVTTSPITTEPVDGAVVQTTSGSKYYLEPKGGKQLKKVVKKAVAQPKKKVVNRTVASYTSVAKRQVAFAKKPAPIKKVPQKPVSKKAPRGVPSLVKWRKNADKSITGFISGSTSFPEGERITTSPITTGDIGSGQVVKTGSGSSYFLV